MMIFDKCKQCIHYHNLDYEYDWCHMCAMEMDCFKAKKLSMDEQREAEKWK